MIVDEHSDHRNVRQRIWLCVRRGLNPIDLDPADLTISKRKWERAVQDWRILIDELCIRHGIDESK